MLIIERSGGACAGVPRERNTFLYLPNQIGVKTEPILTISETKVAHTIKKGVRIDNKRPNQNQVLTKVGPLKQV